MDRPAEAEWNEDPQAYYDRRDQAVVRGYRGPQGGRSGQDLAFAVRWLAEKRKVVKGPEDSYLVTRVRHGHYVLERARDRIGSII